MTSDSELRHLLDAERAVDVARALAQRREQACYAGVAWSGLAPDGYRVRDAAQLASDAAARLAALEHWRRTRSARLLAAMTQAERAVERVRACVARGLAAGDARCGLALGDLERAASAARAAMDGATPAVLSDGPCATSIASGNPSTASPTSSAS
jgi:hypothetical protein